jgi:hypothetical protein
MERKEAIEAGLKIYDGKLCEKHNTTQRYVTSYNCVQCTQERTNNRSPEILKKYYYSDKGKKYFKKYRNSEVNRAIQNRWKKKDYEKRPEQYFEYNLKRYNITADEYWQMFEEQNGVCKVCNEEPGDKKLAVDHCHDTGEVRGLLCSRCNTALGLLREDKNIMKSLMEYI